MSLPPLTAALFVLAIVLSPHSLGFALGLWTVGLLAWVFWMGRVGTGEEPGPLLQEPDANRRSVPDDAVKI